MAQSEQNYVVLVPFYGWYKQVTGHAKRRHNQQKTNSKMTDKMPTLRKIKRAASQLTSRHICSTFYFARPHPSPPTTQHSDCGQLEGHF
jgi:hypothetical protein